MDDARIGHKYNEAVKLNKDGCEEEAIRLLLEIVDEWPESAPAHNFLGSIHWRRGDLDKAIRNFQFATTYRPEWELPSLALFHVLLEKGQNDQAHKEIRRFLLVAESKEYLEILTDLNIELARSPSNYLEIRDEPSQN